MVAKCRIFFCLPPRSSLRNDLQIFTHCVTNHKSISFLLITHPSLLCCSVNLSTTWTWIILYFHHSPFPVPILLLIESRLSQASKIQNNSKSCCPLSVLCNFYIHSVSYHLLIKCFFFWIWEYELCYAPTTSHFLDFCSVHHHWQWVLLNSVKL